MSLATAVPGTRVTSAGEIPGIPGGNSSPVYEIQWLRSSSSTQYSYTVTDSDSLIVKILTKTKSAIGRDMDSQNCININFRRAMTRSCLNYDTPQIHSRLKRGYISTSSTAEASYLMPRLFIYGSHPCCGRLVGWSLTALSTQCRSYRAFKVRLY